VSAERTATVTIDAQRWERVAFAARLAAHYGLAPLEPGDGDDVDYRIVHADDLQERVADAIWREFSGPADDRLDGWFTEAVDRVVAAILEADRD